MGVLSRVNWVDVLVVIIMLRTIYVSFKDGLSHEIFPLFGSVIKLVFALHCYGKMGSMLHSKMAVIPVSVFNMVSFLTIALAAGFVLKLIKGFMDAVIKVTWHPLIEKAGGMLTGILRGAVSVSMVLIFLALIPLSYLQTSIKDRSLYGMFFLKLGPAIYRTVSGGRIDAARIVQEVVSEKNIPAGDKKPVKREPEWEKVLNSTAKKSGGTR